jgi:hypothetical protein
MGRYLSFTSLLFLFLIVSCGKEGSFEQGKPSRGSLQNSAGDCLAKTIAGTYTAGQALSDSNYIDVTVDVTQTGRYTIFTDTVNGYSFKATGNFGSTGTATVRLKGFGTPASAGTNDFIVFYDSSFCSVSVTVAAGGGSGGGTPPSTDHFILTDNSWWSYSTPLAGDTLRRTILGSFNASGVTYKGLKELDPAGQINDTLFFRKSGNNYYELNYIDYYTSFTLTIL